MHRNFRHLDSSSLKAFYFASQTLNFTQAAARAHLTQSGVTQHIQKLEKELNTKLFTRIGKALRLSPEGVELLAYCEESLDRIDRLFEKLQGSKVQLSGQVKYAMPSSCLMSPHFSILLDKRKSFPNIQLSVEIKHSELVLESLLKGEIDFGFSTRHLPHSQLEFHPFVEEEFVLVSSQAPKKTFKDFKEIETLQFLNYPGQDHLAQVWIQHHFGGRASARGFQKLNIRDEITSIAGAIQLARFAGSFGFFPKHCIENELKEKKLFVHSGKIKDSSKSPIYIVQLKNSAPPFRVQRVLDTFWEMAKK